MSGGDGAFTRSPPPSTKNVPLAVLSLAQFTATLEFSIVFVALPDIDRDLQISATLAQWVSSAYAVTLAGWLIVAGRLADRFGAARIFALAMLDLPPARRTRRVWGYGSSSVAQYRASNVFGLCIPMLE